MSYTYMDPQEWVAAAKKLAGEDALAVVDQYCLGKISLQECSEQMYAAIPEENKEAFMELVRGFGRA